MGMKITDRKEVPHVDDKIFNTTRESKGQSVIEIKSTLTIISATKCIA